jgi:aryl-alcohol dehydrogenase-like predicted oxidoreductase
MDRALEHGINYLDTSNIYGLQDGDDWSENVIGQWLAQGGCFLLGPGDVPAREVRRADIDDLAYRGILAEEKAGRGRSRRVSAEQLDRLRPQLTEYEQLCAELGHSPAQLALAWLLQRPAVTSAIVGPDTIKQLDDTVAALDGQVLSRLDEIFPGYRTAKEDYAW